MSHRIAILLLIVSSNILFAQSPVAQTDDLLVETWRQIASFYPRHESSEGETRTFEYIAARLESLGVEFKQQDFDRLSGAHSFSRNMEAHFPGKLDDRLIVVVPVNHEFGATPEHDGSIAPAAALVLADDLSRRIPPVGVTLLFVGAERENLPGYPIGSRVFAQNDMSDRSTVAVYLDIDRPTESFVIDTAAGGIVAPSWAVSALGGALTAAGVPYRADSIRNQLHRAGFGHETPSIRPFLEAGIPAVGLKNVKNPVAEYEGSTVQPVESLVTALTFLIHGFESGIPSRWDRHYVFFQIGANLYVLNEQMYVIGILVLIGAALFYAVAFRVRFERYARTVIRNYWGLPAVYLLLFMTLLLSTLVITRFLDVRAYPQLWHHNPGAFFSLKLSTAVFLFTIAILPLRRTLLTSSSSFYSAASLMVLFVGIVVLAIVQISFTHYFTWAFFWAFLFSALSARPMKVFCLLLAPVPLILAALQLFGGSEYPAARMLLLSGVFGNLLVALIVLPFLLMLIRLDFVIRHPRVGRRSFILKIVAIASAVAILVFAVIVVSIRSYSTESPQPISVIERIDLDDATRTVTLLGRTSLEGLRFTAGDFAFVWHGDPVSMPAGLLLENNPLSLDIERSRFLERVRIRIILTSEQPIYLISATVVSDTPLIIYDANFPITESPDATTARAHIGVLPPDPLEIELTMADLVRGRLVFEVTSYSPAQPVSADATVRIVSQRQIFHFTVEL